MSELHVVFGSGPVGRAVMRELLARGKKVRLVNRSGAGAFPAAVELCAGDAADRRFAREATSGATVVYQCAAPPYERWRELFPRLQAGVLEGATVAGAKLVVMENVYMYGSPYGKPLTERRPMTAMTRKGRVRAEMSQELLAAHAKGKVRVVIGRASDFFGPEVTQSVMGARVFRRALRGQAVNVVGNLKVPHTYAYVPDIARGLVLLGQRDEAFGEVWHLPGPETVTTREFLGMVFAEAGHPPAIRRAGKATLRTVGFFNSEARELVEMMYQFEEPFVVEHGKFVEAFGDISTPLLEAIRATVDWYREQEPEEPEQPEETEEAEELEETEEAEEAEEPGDSEDPEEPPEQKAGEEPEDPQTPTEDVEQESPDAPEEAELAGEPAQKSTE
ncbi:MAG: NAD-dependent epimerase/dehydratase family protein [Acidobacteriota bacterium]|jgi:nucleoside-diphosphate-sugar epimerase